MHRTYLAIIAVLVTVILYLALDRRTSDIDLSPETTVRTSSVAILPFVAFGDGANSLAVALSDEIALNLTAAPNIVVAVDRAAVPAHGSLQAAAARLGARFTLEGSVRQHDGAVRVTVMLVDAQTEAHLWAETYDRPVADMSMVAKEISATVVRALSS